MRPAIGQHGGSAGTACLAELAIGFIAIDLQDTVIITEELLRPHAASARHVAVNDRGWIDAARCPIISDHRTQVAGLRFRSEERRVGKEGVSKCRSRWVPYH